MALVQWLKAKNYQYELTFGLYMLDPWEKAFFNGFVCILLALTVYTVVLYASR